MRRPLSELDRNIFQVLVIGAGINGASAAEHLAAAGYTTLLVDKADFGSGATGRSSRILHCGLRYLAPGSSMWEFVRYPGRLRIALRMARNAMVARGHLAETVPERVVPTKCHFPIYKDGPYAPWQLHLAFQVLSFLGTGTLPLSYRHLGVFEVSQTPLVRWLRDADKLVGVASYREYLFEWPERLCVDAVLDAERMGAVVRNYTAVNKLERVGDHWSVTLSDRFLPAAQAVVSANIVLNMAGTWIDQVNILNHSTRRRLITGTKGAHIVVRLPPECREYAIATLNQHKEPFYCLPWRGLHYFGPTETLYEGDLDDVRVTEDEIDWLIAEANYLLPALKLKRSDVLFTWAGIRPLTYDPAFPKGKRSREIHDLTPDGLPNVFAMTAGPIMTHRSAGQELTQRVRKLLDPMRPPQQPRYATRRFLEQPGSPPLLEYESTVKLSDLRHAAQHEAPTGLVDLLFRRTGVGWSQTMAYEAADKAAESVADIMGWDEDRVREEAQKYRQYLTHTHTLRPEEGALAHSRITS
jgi:glycerol-3-phosphate dehydrogenase